MEDNKSMTVKKTVKSGITFGSALAMVISYTTWKSVGWAIFHGLLSWVYVIYCYCSQAISCEVFFVSEGHLQDLPLAAPYGCMETENPRHTVRVFMRLA